MYQYNNNVLTSKKKKLTFSLAKRKQTAEKQQRKYKNLHYYWCKIPVRTEFRLYLYSFHYFRSVVTCNLSKLLLLEWQIRSVINDFQQTHLLYFPFFSIISMIKYQDDRFFNLNLTLNFSHFY